jgi:GNAT superfamily N-acetyltransferase
MKIRRATIEDTPLILSFIEKKIDFDRQLGAYSGIPKTSEAKIRKTLFGSIPFAWVLFAEYLGQEIGFALYGFRYSSFAGAPSIWLDDLFVDGEMRSRGVGKALMEYLACIAREYDCTHLAWNADARNTRGLHFYLHLGAEITDRQNNRCFLQWIPEHSSADSE